VSNNSVPKIKRFAIIGFPLQHSVSPRLHNRAFKDYGMKATYEKMPIPPEEFEARILQLKREDWGGFNVTIPFKERIIPLLDGVEKTARAIGAVNTIKCDRGRWLGFNTDWLGFLRPIEWKLDDFKHCLILGAGGAARAVAFALIRLKNVKSLIIANRTMHRAELLVNDLQRFGSTASISAAHLNSLMPFSQQKFDLIVNSTSVGMNDPLATPVIDPKPLAHSKTLIYDLIYKPPETGLLKRAKKLGLRTLNGYAMLVHQANAAFEIWTGKPYLPVTLKSLLR